MNVIHQVNMKRWISCHQKWLTIHPPHESISHHMAISLYNKKKFKIWYPSTHLAHVPIHKWDSKAYELWEFFVNSETAVQKFYLKLALMRILEHFHEKILGPNLTNCGIKAWTLLNRSPRQSAFLGVCRNFKNNHSVEYLRTVLCVIDL